MAKFLSCASVTCERCGHHEFNYSLHHCEAIGWEFDVMVGGDKLDLCPKCSREWDRIVGNFLNTGEETDENCIKIKKALDVVYSHGQTDGAHHKAWVIDQMVRRLLGDNYDEWIKEYKYEDGVESYTWDVGIAP